MLNNSRVVFRSMGALGSKDTPTFDLSALAAVAKLDSESDIGSIFGEYKRGGLTASFLLELTLKDRVECALVLASEMLNFFGDRIKNDVACAVVLDTAENYLRFVEKHYQAASCRGEIGIIAAERLAHCRLLRQRRDFNAVTTG